MMYSIQEKNHICRRISSLSTCEIYLIGPLDALRQEVGQEVTAPADVELSVTEKSRAPLSGSERLQMLQTAAFSGVAIALHNFPEGDLIRFFYIILYYVILCSVILYHIIVYYIVLYYEPFGRVLKKDLQCA